MVPEMIAVAPEVHEAQSAYVHEVCVARDHTPDRFDQPVHATDMRAARVNLRNVICDSGAGPSVLSTEFLGSLPPDATIRRLKPKGQTIYGADGGSLHVVGNVRVTFSIRGYHYSHVFRVLKGPSVMILGNDFLAPLKASIRPLGSPCTLAKILYRL